MEIVDNSECDPSRSNLVPVFNQAAGGTGGGRQRLTWVPRGTPRTVQGIKTSGGFYVQHSGGPSFSFAVDESLSVGFAANARPLPLRPGQCVGYRQLDPDQRAAYLHWVSCRSLPAEAIRFCVRVQVAALEWSLFVERADPTALMDELLSVIEHPNTIAEAPLIRLLAWAAFFRSRNVHIAVMEELVAQGCPLDGPMLRLLLSDCAEADQCVWPELGVEVQRLFRSIPDARSCALFRDRFISRFRVLYPNGVGITAEQRRTEAEYKLHCPELTRERCTLQVPDAVPATLLALREVAAPLVCDERLDSLKTIQISEETVRAQAFLSRRSQSVPRLSAPVPPKKTGPVSELDNATSEILLQLIERQEWSELEFHSLAKRHRQMPFAVIEHLNSWAIENFDEPLLSGGSPVAVNRNLIPKLKAKYDQNN